MYGKCVWQSRCEIAADKNELIKSHKFVQKRYILKQVELTILTYEIFVIDKAPEFHSCHNIYPFPQHQLILDICLVSLIIIRTIFKPVRAEESQWYLQLSICMWWLF